MDDGEHRQKDYEKKKFNDTKHKKQKQNLTEEEEYTIKMIGEMKAKPLLEFLQEKYDKLVGKNEKLMFPINNQIMKRVGELKGEFQQEKRERINRFIKKHAQRGLQKNQLDQIFASTWAQKQFDIKPKIRTRPNHHKDFQYILIVIVDPENPGQIIEHFYFGTLEEQIFYEVSYKRMKKQAIQILQNFIDLETKVSQLKYKP